MNSPPTQVGSSRLVEDLRALGVAEGQTLLAHVSLSSIGWVQGGAPTVVAALREAVGATGNIVMLTAT
jgi:aminoglycoside 3-N-acetyltransferase